MASSKFVLVVNTNNDALTTASEIATNISGNPNTTGAGAWDAVRRISEFMQQEAMGRGINVVYYGGAVAAAGTVTFTGRPTAGETMTIANVTFTARNSGATGNEFNTDAGDVSVTAANLAAAINASANLVGIVTATSSLGVVTITSVVPGVIGNGIDLTEALSNTTRVVFSGGVETNRRTISAGL